MSFISAGFLSYSPTAAVETTSENDQIGSIDHLDAPGIIRHQAAYLFIGLQVFWYAEFRKNQNLFRLEPVDVSPAVFVRFASAEGQLFNFLEMALRILLKRFAISGSK